MTSLLRRKRQTTVHGRSTAIRTLASALGFGLFLAGSTASAQTWAPSPSPYGTWRQPAPAGKPSANSWRDGSRTPQAANAKDATAPQPPQPPDLEGAPLPPPGAAEAAPLPPLPPPPSPISAKQPAVIPVRVENEESAPRMLEPALTPYVIQQTTHQLPPGFRGDRRAEEQPIEQYVQLEPPGPDRIFRLESEAALNERMRQEGKTRTPPERITFPDEPVVSTEPYPGRHWPPQTEFVEPNYLCYGRLLFEDKNTERYGWDFGILQPVISTGKFFADVVTLPYHLGTAPCRCYECSAGLCLPGDPVPYLCYPPELSVTGALTEGGAIAAILAIFP